VSYEELGIRDISRMTGEWVPSVGALGGPPSHELYRELVVHADFRLFQDSRARPWVVMRDGLHRHAFRVPSGELRAAIDRFRLRRNVRPLPDNDIEEFVRIIEARVTDPDVRIPVLKLPLVEPGVPSRPTSAPAVVPFDPPEPRPARAGLAPPPLGIPTRATELDGSTAETAGTVLGEPSAPDVDEGAPDPPPLDLARSGGVVFAPLESSGESDLQRYVRVLRRLVRDGDWMGTTRDLSEEIRDDPFTLYTSLLRYRSEIARNNILIANVEDARGLCWLAVDRSRVRGGSDRPLASDRSRSTSEPESVPVVAR